jgi:hypothetical protein
LVHPVHEHADAGLDAVVQRVRPDAADRDIAVTGPDGLVDDQAWRGLRQVFEARCAGVLEIGAAEDSDRDRHVHQALLHLLRGDDDLADAGCVFGMGHAGGQQAQGAGAQGVNGRGLEHGFSPG